MFKFRVRFLALSFFWLACFLHISVFFAPVDPNLLIISGAEIVTLVVQIAAPKFMISLGPLPTILALALLMLPAIFVTTQSFIEALVSEPEAFASLSLMPSVVIAILFYFRKGYYCLVGSRVISGHL
jgi:hypothetical protein